MNLSIEEVWMLRMVKQATALAFVVAQDYQTREVLFLAFGREVLRHHEVSALRCWLRHYAQCGRFGRRCEVAGRHVCPCVAAVPALRRGV